MPADKDEEIFEVVDESNKVIGEEHRGACHKEGLRHRAVYCLVFDTKGKLLLQQRSSRKKIGPDKWDLSLAEHLQPGETYLEAVVRGLQEELGIVTSPHEIEGPLLPHHQRVLEIPGVVKDVEIVTTYRLQHWRGQLTIDEDEVQAVKWVELAALYEDMSCQQEAYTSWLQAELSMLKGAFEKEGQCRN